MGSRRDFLRSGAAATLGAAGLGLTPSGAKAVVEGAPPTAGAPFPERVTGRGGGPVRPLVISSANGVKAIETVMARLAQGADTLDAVIAGVNEVEDDPNDITVGYGGLPNERGVVQLDASVMHGPTHSAGAVAALERIRNPSRVAKLVMRRTDHVLLVGEGALEFARLHGLQEENLLTQKARKIFLHWKETVSDKDDWFSSEEELQDPDLKEYLRTSGTINCNALNGAGDLSGVTSTSGLAFKLPGRVGDSPLIGCGLYVDNDAGACGSTGRGEAVILSCGSHSVVSLMARGIPPEQAALEVLERIVAQSRKPQLLDADGRPNFNVNFYAVNKRGEYAGAAIWSGSQYAVHDGTRAIKKDSAYLLKRKPKAA